MFTLYMLCLILGILIFLLYLFSDSSLYSGVWIFAYFWFFRSNNNVVYNYQCLHYIIHWSYIGQTSIKIHQNPLKSTNIWVTLVCIVTAELFSFISIIYRRLNGYRTCSGWLRETGPYFWGNIIRWRFTYLLSMFFCVNWQRTLSRHRKNLFI